MNTNDGQSIELRIHQFIVKTFPMARKQGVGRDELWLQSGMIDSLGILDLVHFLEEEFPIKVSDEELLPENFQSLSAVVRFVESKSNGGGLSEPPATGVEGALS